VTYNYLAKLTFRTTVPSTLGTFNAGTTIWCPCTQ